LPDKRHFLPKNQAALALFIGAVTASWWQRHTPDVFKTTARKPIPAREKACRVVVFSGKKVRQQQSVFNAAGGNFSLAQFMNQQNQ
jgi:hypothetical protein